MSPPDGLILAIDIGTGSARSAAIDGEGRVRALHATPLRTYHPRHCWVEQAPQDWWDAICLSIPQTLTDLGVDARQIRGVAACGHMHAPVLLDRHGGLVTERAMLWNDKRTETIAARYTKESLHSLAANPPTPAWPGLKLVWLKANAPDIIDKTAAMVMPKDFINFRLTGEIGMDRTEAGSSFLMDASTGTWSKDLLNALDLPETFLAPLGSSIDRIGRVSRTAADATGIAEGLPVFLGAGDYPAAVLGSGVCQPGQVSDITGTSYLLTRIDDAPQIHADVMNVCIPGDRWGAFAVVDAAGDAIRWARQMFEKGKSNYSDITAAAAVVEPGAENLVFLPYLTGERLGQGSSSRAAFLGFTARHTPGHAHRAIMEGVAMAMRDAASPLWAERGQPSAIIAAAGGARARAWLEIKASVLGVPHIPTEEPECGLLGCNAIARTGLGDFETVESVAKATRQLQDAIEPIETATKTYDDMYDVFRVARTAVKPINEALEAIER